jgi:dolichyl-phosphate beta-glucosyltransferase
VTALTIILPCYNEAERLPDALATYLAAFPLDPGAVEVLVVDDGSTDATLAVAGAVAAVDARVRVLRAHPNHGKGFAVRTGMLAARGERVVFTDADGSYTPAEVERVARALTGADVAIGARRGLDEPGGPVLRRLASRVFNLAMRLVLGLPYPDTQCGLKGFRRGAARQLFERARVDGFAFDAEALFLAGRLGLEVTEVPVRAEERDGSKVRLAADALRMLRDMWGVRRAARAGLYDRREQVRDPTG